MADEVISIRSRAAAPRDADIRSPRASDACVTDSVLALKALSDVQHRRRRAVAVGLAILMGISVSTGSIWSPDGLERRLIESVGLALIVVAVVGRAWCSLYIGGRKAAELVTAGPYSVSRNPLYLFSFIGAFGVGAQSGSLTLGLLFLLGAMAIFLPLIRREEAFLRDTMPEFTAYRRRTPRLMPRFDLWKSPEEIAVRPVFFLRTLLDGLPFILAWPLFEAIAALQGVGVLPEIVRWP